MREGTDQCNHPATATSETANSRAIGGDHHAQQKTFASNDSSWRTGGGGGGGGGVGGVGGAGMILGTSAGGSAGTTLVLTGA